jgi:taurine--2-oxoglutarate transaminase
MTTKLDTQMTGQEMVALSKQHSLYEWSRRRTSIRFRREIEGHLLLDARKEALHRLQQPVDVREHRPRRSARHQGDPGSGRDARVCEPVMATEVRAKLGQKLAQICPGDIDVFFFTNGGAEANENAIRIARLRPAVTRSSASYRSYHGGTGAS